MLFLDFIKDLFSFKPECNFCGLSENMNRATGHNGKTVYICAGCLRNIRFREHDFFKSIEGIKD